jgi:hypothetical protein
MANTSNNRGPQKRISDVRPPRRRTVSSAASEEVQITPTAPSRGVPPPPPVEEPMAPREVRQKALPRNPEPIEHKSSLPPAEQQEIDRLDRSVAEFFARKPVTRDSKSSSKPQSSSSTMRVAPASKDVGTSSVVSRRANFSFKTWMWVGGTVGALVAVAFLLSTTFARAFINIRPVVETLTLPPVSLHVLTDAEAVDISKGILPAEYIEFSDTRSFEGKGSARKNINSKARGPITISNSFGSEPQALVANTRFAAPDGKIFRLEKGVTVPGAKIQNGKLVPSTIEAVVVADQAGPAYNIGPSDFTIPGFAGTPRAKGFTGRSLVPMTGGFIGETVVATQADIQSITQTATAEMYKIMGESLKGKIPAGFKILDGAREVAIADVRAPAPDSPGEAFSVVITGKVQAIVFREIDEADLIAGLFSTSTPHVLLTDQSALERKSVKLDLANHQLSYSVGGSIALGNKLDGDAIVQNLAGKSSDEIIQALEEVPGVAAYRMKLFPMWLWSAPKDPSKVKVTIEPFSPS